MWKGQLASLLGRARTASSFHYSVAAGAAVSSLLLAADRNSNDNVHDASALSSPQTSWTMMNNVTSCDSSPTRRARLARHRTLRRIEDTSSQSTLESRYKVKWQDPLGEGAFGAVYLATDRKTGEEVAVKKINKNMTDDVSFQREMNALLHLRNNGGHPNIYALKENFNEGGNYILVFDLVSGGEMFDHLVSQGAYSEADAARLVREVASALSFLHGIDCVHADLKPENLMLSTKQRGSSVIKVVDFGCAQVTAKDSAFPLAKDGKKGETANTPAYCPPEVLDKRRAKSTIDPSMDMWSLGVILYIMLTGIHPFDIEGNASDEEIKRTILKGKTPPLRDSPITAHLSPDAIELIEKLLTQNPKKRMTAIQMLDHPWVRGETARQDIMAGSDQRLKQYRMFKSRLEAQVFEDIVNWADDNGSGLAKKTSLIERSFQKLDPEHKGYVTTKDLKRLTEKSGGTVSMEMNEESVPLSLSGFSDLLSDNLKNKFYPQGHVLFREGDRGDAMYFVNSGVVEVATKDGLKVKLGQGDFFGEGALLGQNQKRSGSVKCITPVHLIEISREYFNKYLGSSGQHLNLNLREKNMNRKQNRAKSILRLQNNLRDMTLYKGDYLYEVGDEGREVFILEEGKVDVLVEDHVVLSIKPGDWCGEHSLIFSRPRNTSAVCVSEECQLHVMTARDFNAFLRSSNMAKETLQDIAKRREFQKAIVFKTKRRFPKEVKDLREAFDAADEDSSNFLSLENVRSMLKRMDPSLTEKEIQSILKALDLDESGQVSFEEFKRIFQFDDVKTSAMR